MAQLVEQRIRNAWVTSSSLVIGSILYAMAIGVFDKAYAVIITTQSVWHKEISNMFFSKCTINTFEKNFFAFLRQWLSW